MKRLRLLTGNKAFTLLELIVVIGISAAVGALGVYGLVNFRQTTILKQASREFFTHLETARNKARNNTLSSVKEQNGNILNARVDAYAIYIDRADNNYSLLYCQKENTSFADYVCFDERTDLKLQIYNEVKVYPAEGGYACNGILFETVTANIKIFSDRSIVNTDDTQSCLINIEFNGSILKETIRIDAMADSISYQK